MRLRKLALAGFASILSFLIVASGAVAASLTPAESTLLAAINRARAAHGLGAVRYDPRIERAARWHSTEMLRDGSFSHGAFVQRIAAFGIHQRFVGENIAWIDGPTSAADVIVRWWLNSPDHRENMLRPGITRIGVGAIRGTFAGHQNVLMVTADFAGE
jgi:uncharacterized protein YkwD